MNGRILHCLPLTRAKQLRDYTQVRSDVVTTPLCALCAFLHNKRSEYYPQFVSLLAIYCRFSSHCFYRASAVAASPVLATIEMSVRPSVRPSVRHTLTLCENDAS